MKIQIDHLPIQEISNPYDSIMEFLKAIKDRSYKIVGVDGFIRILVGFDEVGNGDTYWLTKKEFNLFCRSGRFIKE